MVAASNTKPYVHNGIGMNAKLCACFLRRHEDSIHLTHRERERERERGGGETDRERERERERDHSRKGEARKIPRSFQKEEADITIFPHKQKERRARS